uniref:KIND domain-containing protein n=1 Tax=Sinocyclocheilus rhinocerous TaxID=307959 RepID=A0A673FKP6_9TELE
STVSIIIITPSAGALISNDLSLDEILHLYKQPINEEQAWAVCYQCCRSSREDSAGTGGAEHVRIYKDGSVRLHSGDRSGDKSTPSASIIAFLYI